MNNDSTKPTIDQWKELDADALRHQHDAVERPVSPRQSNTGRLPFAPPEHGDDAPMPEEHIKEI